MAGNDRYVFIILLFIIVLGLWTGPVAGNNPDLVPPAARGSFERCGVPPAPQGVTLDPAKLLIKPNLSLKSTVLPVAGEATWGKHPLITIWITIAVDEECNLQEEKGFLTGLRLGAKVDANFKKELEKYLKK